VKKSIIREVPVMSWATGAWGVWWLALAVTYGTVAVGALAHGDWRADLAWEAVSYTTLDGYRSCGMRKVG
jgi:hypothetical protein